MEHWLWAKQVPEPSAAKCPHVSKGDGDGSHGNRLFGGISPKNYMHALGW